VRRYLERFRVDRNSLVLDPFCGTGTTLVECKKLGIPSVGIERNPMASFASRVKTDWSVEPDILSANAERIAANALREFRKQGLEETQTFFRKIKCLNGELRALPLETRRILLAGSISPLPLHRVLSLLDSINRFGDPRCLGHEQLALAKTIVFHASNLRFGPEVGVGSSKGDVPVLSIWLDHVRRTISDLRDLRGRSEVLSKVHEDDARDIGGIFRPGSIDVVITSPPYPNEKDYTRTTRLESAILGFINNKEELRLLKKGMVRSNTRGVYKDDEDHFLVSEHREIQKIAREIESRRIKMGKTSGFERMYPKVTQLYFGGMFRHFSSLRSVLRPGALLAYVVGDQASYLRVMIRTGGLLAGIARSLGYEVAGLDLFRTRRATATGEQLREEVLLLRWPGESSKI
jgi:hypothetical protein